MPRRRHPVWESFRCITNKNTGRWAICKTCKKGMQGIPYRLAMHRQKCEVKSNVENEECRGIDHFQENRGKNGDNLQPEQKLEIKVEESRVSEICRQDKQQHLKTVVNPLLVADQSPKRTPGPQIAIKREDNSVDETPTHSIIPNINKQQKLADNLPLLLPAVQKANDNPPMIASQEVDDCQTALVEEMDYEQQELDSCPSSAAQKTNACCSVLAVQSPNDCDPFKKRLKLVEDPQPRGYGKNNDCDLFGEYISEKMKQFDHKTRCVVQYLMSNILFQADMGTYREGSFDCQSLIGFHASDKHSKSNVNECNRN